MSLRRVVRHEWRLLRSDRTAWTVAALLAITVAYGLYNGSQWVRFRQATVEAARAEQKNRYDSLKMRIAEANAGARVVPAQDPRAASTIGSNYGQPYAAMNPAPLASLAIGQSDLYPYYYKVSTRSKSTFLNSDEIENPSHLLSGRFDLAFVVVYLFPIFVLGLSYNLLSGEKEQGTLALALSQPMRLRTLVVGKILLRLGVVLTVVLAVAAAAFSFAGVRTDAAVAAIAMWIFAVSLYACLWFLAAVAVNASGGSSSANAIALGGLWLAFVLLTPTLLGIAAASTFPVPSRVEMIQALREATNEANRKGTMLLARYYEDHPELAPNATAATQADFSTRSIAVQQEVEAALEPMMARYDAQLQAQQSMAHRFRFLSPAILVQFAMNDLAGAGPDRHRHFVAQVERFHTQWREFFVPRIMKRQPVASVEIDSLPRFDYRDEPADDVRARVWKGIAGLTAMTLAAGLYAFRKLRQYPVAG